MMITNPAGNRLKIDEKILFCILRANIKLDSMLVVEVVVSCFTLTTFRTLKHSIDAENDSIIFLV